MVQSAGPLALPVTSSALWAVAIGALDSVIYAKAGGYEQACLIDADLGLYTHSLLFN